MKEVKRGMFKEILRDEEEWEEISRNLPATYQEAMNSILNEMKEECDAWLRVFGVPATDVEKIYNLSRTDPDIEWQHVSVCQFAHALNDAKDYLVKALESNDKEDWIGFSILFGHAAKCNTRIRANSIYARGTDTAQARTFRASNVDARRAWLKRLININDYNELIDKDPHIRRAVFEAFQDKDRRQKAGVTVEGLTNDTFRNDLEVIGHKRSLRK